MFKGQAAIEYLGSIVANDDKATSSHWLKYHSNFKFTGNGFEGLEGFGSNHKPRNRLFQLLENILQRKYRAMSCGQFSAIDKIGRDLAKKQNRSYDLDMLRQALTVSFLRNQIPNVLSTDSIGCVIGDGFGTISALLLESQSAKKNNFDQFKQNVNG